ncbi:hypothetical protein HDV00_004145 [Rhizophlyctis rosea]|nr:hypothetical protein HDV00_004145 [Rhizophlyctis rosea]
MPVDVKVTHDEDETHSDTEIVVEEEDQPVLEPVSTEPCGPIEQAKGWFSNFFLGRKSHCVERPHYPPVEKYQTVRIVYEHVHKHPSDDAHGKDRLYLDQSNGQNGFRKMHRYGKEKAAEWKDGIKREGHEWKEGIERTGEEWQEGIERKGEEWKDGIKREGHYVADKLGEAWDRAKQEGQELGDEIEDAADAAKEKAHQVAGQVKGKASDTMNNLRRIPTKAKEEYGRVEDYAKEKLESARQAAATATDFAKAEGERLKIGVEDTIENVKDTVREGVETVHNTANHVKDAAKEKIHRAQHRIHQAGHEAKEEIHGAFNRVETGAEHAFHKFEECLGCPPRRNDLSTFRREDLAGRYGAGYYDRPYGWNPIPITSFYTALSTLWFLWLLRKVWVARNRAGVPAGDGSHQLARELTRDVTVTSIKGNGKGKHGRYSDTASPAQSDDDEETPMLTTTTARLHVEYPSKTASLRSLIRAVDARNTYVQNAAFMLALLAIMELNHAARPLLHLLFVTFTIGNLAQSNHGRALLGKHSLVGPKATIGALLFSALGVLYYCLRCQAQF